MAIIFGKPSLEKYAYQVFQAKFKAGGFGKQRYGQAFYDHFKLHKLVNQQALCGLYEKDGDEAKRLISKLFKFN